MTNTKQNKTSKQNLDQKTSATLTIGTRNKLMDIKYELGFKDIEEAITHLISIYYQTQG